MSLAPGTRLGPYEITAAIGAGGMGEVYRARDARLNRDVAIKILPDLFAADSDRIARFQREAQVLASLNHPNIAAIYGFEEADGLKGLVLELVDGPTLADRIAHGPIPLDEALPIARQIAEALEAAHDHGIIHRDLKPANIKLRSDGSVKVLDFGLAKTADPSSSIDSSLSPTLTSPMMTRMGVILGTAAYMSPEQARGRSVDKRTDVWAFGCVLYEMLTGQRAFGGDDLTVTLAAIIRGEPNWKLLPAATPAPVRRLLRRALAKDRAERLADVSVARLEISDAMSPNEETAPRRTFRGWIWTAAALVLIAAASISMALFGTTARTATGSDPLWFTITPPNNSLRSLAPTLSPDGQRIAFVAAGPEGEAALWIRSFARPDSQELIGTAGALSPFWSPDGQSLAFFAKGKLKRVEIGGGSPQDLADAPGNRGGAWSGAGVILYAPSPGDALYSIPASGGVPTKVTALDGAKGEQEHLFPSFLPDGRHFLYIARFTDERATSLRVESLESGESHVVGAMRSRAEYANGHLFFGRDENLFAQPFDLDRFHATGEPRRVADRIGMSFGNMTNYAFSARENALVTSSGWYAPVTQLKIFDRTGKLIQDVGDSAELVGVALSPDQRTAATESRDPKTNTADTYLYDMASGVRTRVTSGDRTWTGSPVWSPDGRQILFTDWADNYYVKNLQNGRVERWPHKMKGRGGWPLQWSSDGRYVVVANNDQNTRYDIWLLPMSGERNAIPYLATRFSETMPTVSPDTRWLAYVSDESGASEVYVSTFPAPGAAVRISIKGGTSPMWSEDGKDLYYFDGDQQLVVAALQTKGADVGVTGRHVLFKMPLIDRIDHRRQYAVFNRGQRFLVNAIASEQPHRNLTVLMNWLALLRK